jgi:hypothetical protein
MRKYQFFKFAAFFVLLSSSFSAAINPVVDFDSVMFVRYSIGYGHIQVMGAASLINGEGGLYVLSGLQSGNHVIRNVLQNSVFENGPRQGRKFSDFGSGAMRSAELNYDGKRIVFAWSPKNVGSGRAFDCVYARDNGYNLPEPNEGSVLQIYTVNLDGTNLRQVTSSNWDELDPTWLPNGRIAFMSQRAKSNVRCQPSEWAGFLGQNVLFSIKADGSDVVQLSWHETNEAMPSVDNSGSIVYTRWDYIDRDFSAAHNFWQCNADGTDPRAPHGNYYLGSSTGGGQQLIVNNYKGDGRTERPWAEYGIRAIPGTYGKFLAVAGPHHGPQFGIPIMIDINIPDDYKDAQVTLLRPGCEYYPHESNTGCKSNVSNACAYHCPWPLNEKYFLISKATGNDLPDGFYLADTRTNRVNMALYLMDMDGNEELISTCQVPKGGQFMRAQPVKTRPLPPITVTRTYQGERRNTPEHKRAVISVMNVYKTDLPFPEDVVRDKKIKEMRIVQLLPKDPCPGGEDNPLLGYGNGALARAALGTVPVEADGSVYFEAPVEKALYFQLLDDKGAAVQSMRSLTYVHPGEHLTCVGCHENKWESPNIPVTPIAMQRLPSKIKPEPSGSLPFSFGNLVKPVFDNTCAPCHTKKGIEPKDFSYSALRNWAFFYPNMGGAEGGGSRSLPGQIGARGSRMGKALLATHKDTITVEEMRRVTLWLDLCSPEMGSYSMNAQDQQNQKMGGPPVYHRHIDPKNPTGVELDRPLPGVSGIIRDLNGHGPKWYSNSELQIIIDGSRCSIVGNPLSSIHWAFIDIRGRVLRSGTGRTNDISLDIRSMVPTNGTYIIQAWTPGGKRSSRLFTSL